MVFVGYGVAAYCLLYLLNRDTPIVLENAIVMLAFPLQLLVAPWMDLLHGLGLTEGEWVKVPSIGGFVFVILFYALVLYVILWLIVMFLRNL